MSSHNQHYRDTDFNPEQSADHTLLVQIEPGSFSYAVTANDKLLALGENISLSELTDPTEENKFLLASFKQCIVGLPNSGFTFIPVSLFRPDRVTDFARFLDVKASDKVFSQPLDVENQVIYKVNDSVANLAGKFEAGKSVFAAKGWINAIAACKPANETIYLNIGNDSVELLNFHEGKLRFYNGFEFKSEDELVYFTALVADELQLQPSSTTLIISSNVELGDKNFNRLTEFFHEVKINDLKVIDLPGEIASHTVLTLTALTLCGSSEAL